MDELRDSVQTAPNSREAEEAIDELIDTLNGNWGFAKCRACEALGKMGPLSARAIPHLLNAARKGDRFVSQAAVRALSLIAVEAATSVDLFIEIIESVPSGYSPGLKETYAFQGIANIGMPAASKAIHLLEQGLKAENPDFARLSSETLEKLDSKNAANFEYKHRLETGFDNFISE